MTALSHDARERARALMMSALDGEIAPGERRELEELLARDPELMEEWRSMERVKDLTSDLTYREPPEEVWEVYWESVYNKIERGIGWVLLSLGAVVLFGWGAWHAVEAIARDTTMPAGIKLAILAVAIGGIVLGVSVAREKLFAWRRDPYRRVKR